MTVEPAAAPLLAGYNISVHFGGLVALSDVSIEVPERTIVGLIGPNGAGKSTMLGVLSGLLTPRSGRVVVNGVDMTSQPSYKRARAGLACTFQQPELFAGLSVREHLVLAWRVRFDRGRLWRDLLDARGWRKPAAEEDSRVDHLLEILGLSALRDAPVAGLSLGLARLVEVGRALAASPQVVLLDEPLSGLDITESSMLANLLEELTVKEGVSFLLVDHDVDTVLAKTAKVVVLDFGQLIAEGTPDEVRANELVKVAYLGENFMADNGGTS